MKKKKEWFEIYPDDGLATKFSVAGGAARLLAVLLMVAAVPATLLVAATGVRFALLGNLLSGLLYMFDELGGVLAGGFLLVALACGAWYASCVLRRKAETLVGVRAAGEAPVLPEGEQAEQAG